MMRNSFILLTKILVTFVFILCITSAESASNTFTEKGLSLLGYHLCNYSVIKNVSKTVAYQKSYEKQTPCGGWIPWKMCSTTYYKEEYHPIMVQEAVNVTDCCAGYEQVGLYCSLSINRSSEFASRPGACPTKIGEALKSSCVSDMDCPEYKKCCKTSMGTHCSDPVPEEQTVTKYWYNVSVLVKMDFSELNKVDPKLLNHSRLLHSMITGALWPMNISVYHIQTKSETYAETLVSYVLVGLQQLVPLVNISSLLKEIVKRVSEVIDIVVQDCDPDMPNVLIKNKHSSNLLRSSRSASPEIHGSVDLECDSPPIRNHKIFNVTCSSFEASWSVNSLQNHSFRAEVYKGKKLVERMETTDMKLTMLNLEAGVMYTMDISYEACGKNITSSRTVKTGEILDPVTTQGSNVTHNTTTPFSMAEIQAVTSFTKYTEATVLPSSSIQESSTLPAEKALSASQKMNVSGHVRNDSILNSPETATPAPKWWGNVTILNGTVAEELSTLPAEKILSASQKMNVSEHVRNDSILNSPETATPAPKWWGNVTILNGTVAEELSTLPAEKILSASQKMNVSGHVRNDSILNSPETATPAPKWWSNVTILNGTVAEESSTLPAEKILSASQKMNVSEHVRNDSILNSPETATPAPKWWGNVTILNGTVAEESSTLPAEKILSASQKMNVSEHVRNDSILNSPETATPAPKWWGNVTILNGTVAEESSTLPAEKILSASQKMNVSEHVRNDSILNSPETATPAPKWWSNVTILNGTVAEESSTLPADKILSASQKMNVSEHVRNDSILNSPETATPAPKWWGNVTILNGTVAEELSTLPAEKILSASQKMNVSEHVRNDSILNSPETATPAPKWWGNVTILNGTVAEESSTLPAEKILSASQKMNVSEHVRNDSILNSPETATPAPKWWGNVTILNGTVAEESSTLPAEKILSASQKMNVSGHVRNDSILNSPETATPAPKWWGNVTILNGTVAEESSTLPAEKVLSASQKMNVSGHVRNDSILNSPETATPAPKWWGNVTVSNGTVAEESSTLPAEKVLSASQKMNISGHVRNDSILNSPETTTPAPKWWGNVTVSNGTVAEERWTTQDQQNSSVTSSPGVSNIETSPFKRNESIVEEGTPGLSVERRFENVISLNVTQNPKCHALNHTLDRDIGGNDSSWSDERNSTASPSSFRSNISLATDLSAPFPAERIFFSNVTNTSFQISWTTHFSANTTFHVLLFEEELLIKKVKTQSSHLNISELKAGTLYTVKIKADLYGNESKTVQRKVKTAAQKFNGMVRIVNLNYSSEFSNSRSEKRQNFSKMFLNEVRTSLPPNILQKMDAGMINISIVSIIPGSIVVNYSLLIPIDMDARNVSGSLLEAFRNSSHFEVDNSSLSIYDNNECEREETDCSPNATCYNIYGSYGCKCKEGFVSVNAERPGRNCEVLSSSLSSGDARSKEWSSIALPLTDPYTSDPMPSSAGDNFSTSSSRNLENATANTTINKKTINRTTNIHDLPQNSSLINGSTAVSIKEAVQVLCEFEKIVISIKKDFLHQQSIPESSLYLGNPRCNVTSSNSSHVVLHTDWNECETEIQTNTTHTIAKTVLRNDYSSHRIIRYLKISSQIHCTFENNLLTSSGYTSEGIYTIFEDLHGSGHFLTEMRLFIGNSPIPQNFSISGSDNIMIEVGVQTRSKKLKLVVGQCWATPTNNSMDPHSFHFIHGSCPVPNINTIVIANGISNRARFKLKIFSFVNSSVVYLHCKIKICVEIPKSTCRTNCEGFRFWKSGEIIATPKTTWGPLHKFSAGLKEEKKSGLGVGYIVLIVTGVLVLALGIAGLLVCRHKRKAGTYDFKRRTEYFNYRAFHD